MGTKIIGLDTISSLYKAMNVIEMKTRGENDHVPEDFKGQFDLYRVMKSLDIRNRKFLSYFQEDFFKIANSRNPFTRLYSAWNDKSRTHRRQDGSGLVSHCCMSNSVTFGLPAYYKSLVLIFQFIVDP